MKTEAVRNIAKALGIHPGKLSITKLIKPIQTTKGNFGCFATAYAGECDQVGYCWLGDCFEPSKKGELS